jgi:hypothetical protein
MEHQPTTSQQPTIANGQILKQPTANEMISILHQHQVLDHYEEMTGIGPIDQYVQIQINDQQDYRDCPKIQLEYEGGCVWCWEPDEDREIWTFTYASNEGDNESWEAFIPAHVRKAIIDIATQYGAAIYSYNGPEGADADSPSPYYLNITI